MFTDEPRLDPAKAVDAQSRPSRCGDDDESTTPRWHTYPRWWAALLRANDGIEASAYSRTPLNPYASVDGPGYGSWGHGFEEVC
jgi:hypothetical protein